jgi:uncharacterized membrane protein YccC
MMAFAERMLGSLRGRKTQLALAVRLAVAAVAAYAIARALHLMLPLWAVLTSLIVTQMSVGRSLKATRDYMLGTIGGAVYGGAIAMLIPHSGEGGLLALLAGGGPDGFHRRDQSQPERRHGDGRDRVAGSGDEPR